MTAAFCPACRHSRDLADDTCAACGVPRPPAGWPIDSMVGRLIDSKYRIDRRLSTGGFGTVFIATQMHGKQELGTAVLKFLHPELAHDPNVSKRFVTEAKAARELSSPHVVRVFDLGFSEEGIPFMVQEYVAGEGLDQIIKQGGPLAVDRVMRIGMQIAEAMDEAHGKGILHRDLKPENLRIQASIQGDFAKVLDFGIARVERGTSAATNSFIGTPRYMPPEQIKQKGVDARSDVFALGVILFEMLTGEPPILAESEMEYIHLNLVQEPRDVRTLRPGLPNGLADLVMRMMAKEKEARPASMAIVYTALRGGGIAGSTIVPVESGTLPFGALAAEHRRGAEAPSGQTIKEMPRTRRGIIVGAAAGAVLLVVGVVGIGVMAGGSDLPPAGASGLSLPTPAMTVSPLPPLSPPAPTIAPTAETAAPATAAQVEGEAPPDEPATGAPAKRPRPRPRPRPEGGDGATKVEKLDD